MPKLVCRIEYDGQHYCGWQYQDHSPSIQQCVEYALSKVADQNIKVICAGRTDTGVHATGQVIHFETSADRPLHSWQLGANSYLPTDIAITWLDFVDIAFHARYSAINRKYRYIIYNSPVRSALLSKKVTWFRQKLDHQKMHLAAQALIGEHDFTAYRAAGCQSKSPNRRILTLTVSRAGDFIYIDITANAFLHHMVRNIVGVLMTIGCGEAPVAWAAEVLACRDRTKGGVTALPHGLYLIAVEYPSDFGIATIVSGPIYS